MTDQDLWPLPLAVQVLIAGTFPLPMNEHIIPPARNFTQHRPSSGAGQCRSGGSNRFRHATSADLSLRYHR